ncbi:hypothetical protein GW17_00011707 [Ensete ventricosum]|nr:hypothetical protein GW17_00011707 [Ensete ventricosum]
MTLYLQKLYLFICRDKLYLKCQIQLNQLWLLKQHSQILSYFHYLSQEWTMLFEVFPIDDRKKIRSLQQQYQHGIYNWMEIKIRKEHEEGIHMSTIYGAFITMMPSISVIALPDRNEGVKVQLMIAWDRRIVMHHRPNTTTPDGKIQDNAGPSDHSTPTVDTTRKLQGELQIETQSSWSLSLEDKAYLKRTDLLGL